MNLKICFSNAIDDHVYHWRRKIIIIIIKPNKTYLASHVWQKQTNGSEFSFSLTGRRRDMRRPRNLRHAITWINEVKTGGCKWNDRHAKHQKSLSTHCHSLATVNCWIVNFTFLILKYKYYNWRKMSAKEVSIEWQHHTISSTYAEVKRKNIRKIISQ